MASRSKALLWGALLIVAGTQCASADSTESVKNAFFMCAVVDATGMASEKCSVSGWHSSVDVTIDTTGAEARQICLGMVTAMAEKGLHWDAGWQVRIYSPFSGDHTIAFCALPR